MADNAKDYILSILARLQGQQAVTSGLTGIGDSAKQVGTTLEETGKKTQDFADVLNKATSRALLVAPVWLALRAGMLLVLDTIKLMINANLDLEVSLANIQTTLRGSAQSIQSQSNAIKELIISIRSPISGKELGVAFVELNKVLQDTATSMIAFKSAEVLMADTGLSAKEAGSLLAKTYNELGNTMDATLTTAEKFQKITDILVYTTKTQGVDIKDLAQGYSKLAPFLTGTSDKFEDVITLLGFLSTHFIEGGRAGQSLATELVNIQKNSKALAEAFHIQLNPKDLMSIIGTFREIGEQIQATGKISNEQSLAISKVFGGARTSSPVRESVANIERLVDALDNAKEHATGFAEKTKTIIEHTTIEQFKELMKVIGDLSNTFATPFGDSFVKLLENVNHYLISIRPNIEGLGVGIAYLAELNGRLSPVMQVLTALNGGKVELPRSFTAFVDEYIKNSQKLAEEEKKRASVSAGIPEQDNQHTNSIKEETMYTKELGNMLSAMGVNESQILVFKLQQLQAMKDSLDPAYYELKLETLKYQQAVAILKEREKATKELEKEQTLVGRKDELEYIKESGALLSALGADESQVLAIKIQELEANNSILDAGQKQIELDKLHFQQVVAVAKAREQEGLAQASFAVQYAQADEFDRAKLKRLQELRNLSTETVVGKLNQSPFDADIIEKNLSKFSKETQIAIGQALTARLHLPGEPLGGLTTLPTEELKQLSTGASAFWDEWENRKQSALASWSRDFATTVKGAFGEANPFGANAENQPFNPKTMEKRMTIDPIAINLHIDSEKMSGEEIADAVSRAVKVEIVKKSNLDKIANHTLNEYQQ